MVKTTATICFCSKEALADSSETAHSWSGRKELAEGSGRYAINGLSERKSLRGRFTMKTWHLSGAIVLVGVFLSTIGLSATYDLTGQLTVSSSGHWNQCGISNPGTEESTIIFVQHRDSASIFDINEGFMVEASVSGAQYTIITDYCQEVGGEDVCAPSTCTVTATSDSNASGTCNWTYSNGNTCSGGYNVSLAKEFQSNPTYNATGLWIYFEQPGGWNDCGVTFSEPARGPLTVTQTGNKVESVDKTGKGYAGFVNGSTYTMVTYYYENGRNVSQILTITLGSGGTIGSGSCRWFWRGGPDTLCGGGFPLVAEKAWTIMATAGFGGTISPSGSIVVPNNWNQLITITPDKGYRIKDVRVDGVSVGAIETYTFSNVQAAHTIEAFFRKRGGLPFLGLFDD